MAIVARMFVGIDEVGEGVVHVHRVDLFENGECGVSLHDGCINRNEIDLDVEMWKALGLGVIKVEDERRTTYYAAPEPSLVEIADYFTYRALIASGEYEDDGE